jgi:hypothetical protein
VLPITDLFRKSYQFNTNSTVRVGAALSNKTLYCLLLYSCLPQDYSEYEGFNIEFSGLDQIGFIKRGTFDKTQLIVNQLLGKHKYNKE